MHGLFSGLLVLKLAKQLDDILLAIKVFYGPQPGIVLVGLCVFILIIIHIHTDHSKDEKKPHQR